MQDLTFGEQVKIVLSRKNMTIKELARKIELRTKKKMSRQNLTQRLGRDNFQEQDMRMIAEILGCSFYLDILGDSAAAEKTGEEDKSAAAGNGEKKETAEKLTEGNLADRTEEQIVEELPDPERTGGKDASGNTGDAGNKDASGKAEDTSGKDTNEKAPSVNERDITIGELVDIHEELDAMMEEAASGSLEQGDPELADYGKNRAEYDDVDVHVKDYAGYDDADAYVKDYAVYDNADAHTEGYTVYTASDVHTQAAPDEAEEGEPVEKLLEEIESMERENKKEERAEEKPESQEKTHGWRTYFMQRLKRRGKEQSWIGEEGHADKNAGTDYPEEGYAENGYAEGDYAANGYSEGNYAENGSSDGSYPGNVLDTMNEEAAYAEEEYMQAPQEDEDIGEYNPYTGKEYESNSVRMHPSRIGYVQVYDRSNHQWTDMTEWAFLGYQERKKQLLGKDYDPPIYLD